jgi:phage major head subunit gpT-like protein
MPGPGVHVSENFSILTDIDPILNEIFHNHLNELPSMMPTFYRVLNSTKSKETDYRVGTFSDPVVFDTNNAINYTTVDPDNTITYTHTQYARGFKTERAFMDDQQYEPFFDNAENLGRSFGRKIEKDAASTFNNAFTTAGYDGAELCADDHPRSLNDSTAVDNKAALTLTSDNLETVWLQSQALTDDQGELFDFNADLLLVPPALKKKAQELTRSSLDPESGENAVNVWQDLRYLSWNRLTDTNAWFLIDTRLMKASLKWFWRVMPEFNSVQDFDTMFFKHAGYMRYSYGYSEFRWVVGSNPS